MTEGGSQKPLIPGGGLAGTPACETCGRPAQGVDTFTVPAARTAKKYQVRKRYACRGEGCHRGSFVAFPWVYRSDDAEDAPR